MPAPASTRGRPRRDAVASRQSSAATWRACAGVDAPWSATRCARPRPPPPPLPFAPVCSYSLALSPPLRAAERRHRHWRSELRSGRSSSVREPFIDSSLPELCPHFAVAGHASGRLVTHGEPSSPSLSSPTRAPPPRVWPARHRASRNRLASASCSPLYRNTPEPLQSRSTGPAPRVGGEQRHRSAMAGGELALVRLRSRKVVHLVRLEP